MAHLKNVKYCILDIEAISLHSRKGRQYGPPPGAFSHVHNCTRKMAVQLWNEKTYMEEFHPCLTMNDLSVNEKKSYYWCKRKIHHLDYNPYHGARECMDAPNAIMKMIRENEIQIILYKGGVIEKDMAYLIGVECVNLEDFGIAKAPDHNPLNEVAFYHRELKKLFKN